MRKNILFFSIVLSTLSNCKKQGFSGSSNNPAAASPTPAPSPSLAPIDAPAKPTTPPISPSPTCLDNLTYKPEEVLCHIPVNAETTWAHTVEWKAISDAFRDRQAEWISPLPATTCATFACCPFVPNSNKLFYVSTFSITADDTFQYDVITDDLGVTKIWRNSDPSQPVLTTPQGKSATGATPLSKGNYAVVIEAIDTSATATGAVFSLRNNQGTLVKHTAQNDNWCIFQVGTSEIAETYIPAAAACRKCFGKP